MKIKSKARTKRVLIWHTYEWMDTKWEDRSRAWIHLWFFSLLSCSMFSCVRRYWLFDKSYTFSKCSFVWTFKKKTFNLYFMLLFIVSYWKIESTISCMTLLDINNFSIFHFVFFLPRLYFEYREKCSGAFCYVVVCVVVCILSISSWRYICVMRARASDGHNEIHFILIRLYQWLNSYGFAINVCSAVVFYIITVSVRSLCND